MEAIVAAALQNNVAVVRHLVDRTPDVDLSAVLSATCDYMPVSREEVQTYLIEAGADPTVRCNATLLHAMLAGDVAFVRELLAMPVVLSDRCGWFPVAFQRAQAHRDMFAALLLATWRDPYFKITPRMATSVVGATPLHRANTNELVNDARVFVHEDAVDAMIKALIMVGDNINLDTLTMTRVSTRNMFYRFLVARENAGFVQRLVGNLLRYPDPRFMLDYVTVTVHPFRNGYEAVSGFLSSIDDTTPLNPDQDRALRRLFDYLPDGDRAYADRDIRGAWLYYLRWSEPRAAWVGAVARGVFSRAAPTTDKRRRY